MSSPGAELARRLARRRVPERTAEDRATVQRLVRGVLRDMRTVQARAERELPDEDVTELRALLQGVWSKVNGLEQASRDLDHAKRQYEAVLAKAHEEMESERRSMAAQHQADTERRAKVEAALRESLREGDERRAALERDLAAKGREIERLAKSRGRGKPASGPPSKQRDLVTAMAMGGPHVALSPRRGYDGLLEAIVLSAGGYPDVVVRIERDTNRKMTGLDVAARGDSA